MTCSHPLGNFSFGSECHFACKESFSLNGSKLLICSSAGSWSSRLPVCSGKLRRSQEITANIGALLTKVLSPDEGMPLGTAMVIYTLVGGASAALLLALLGVGLLFATRFRKTGETRIDTVQYHPVCSVPLSPCPP